MLISSILNPEGVPAEVVRPVTAGRVEVVVAEEILAEYRRALAYPRLEARHRLSREEQAAAIEALASLATTVALPKSRNFVPEDPNDDMFVGAALAGEANYLVTGDRALRLAAIAAGVQAVSPREFVSILNGDDQ